MVLYERQPQHAGLVLGGESLSAYIASFYFQTLLFGIYVVLFIMSIFLLQKNKGTTARVYLSFGMVLFALATADLGYSYHFLFRKFMKQKEPFLPLSYVYVKVLLYATSNLIADGILIYRCYALWGRRIRIVVTPIILLTAVTVFGYTFINVTSSRPREIARIHLWLTFVTNTIISILTGLKIGSISRELGQVLGAEHVNRCRYPIAVLVESGMLYSIYILLSVLVQSTIVPNALIQVVGIVPTIIVIQVGLGRHTRSVEKTLSDSTTTMTNATSTQHQTETTSCRD